MWRHKSLGEVALWMRLPSRVLERVTNAIRFEQLLTMLSMSLVDAAMPLGRILLAVERGH